MCVAIDYRPKAGIDARETSSDDGNSDSNDAATNYDSDNQDESAADKSTEEGTKGNDALAAVNEQAKKMADGACPTLLIANLGLNCTEEELKQVLSQISDREVDFTSILDLENRLYAFLLVQDTKDSAA